MQFFSLGNLIHKQFFPVVKIDAVQHQKYDAQDAAKHQGAQQISGKLQIPENNQLCDTENQGNDHVQDIQTQQAPDCVLPKACQHLPDNQEACSHTQVDKPHNDAQGLQSREHTVHQSRRRPVGGT